MTNTPKAWQPIGWVHMLGEHVTCFTKNPNEPLLKGEKKEAVYLPPEVTGAKLKFFEFFEPIDRNSKEPEAGEVAALKMQLDALKSAMHQTRMIGRKCLSEDDCITAGIDFAAYERGVIHAVGAMQNHLMEAIASDKKEGAEA